MDLNFTQDEARAALSLIASEAHRLSDGQRITRESRARAAENVATAYSATAFELNSAIGRAFGPMGGEAMRKKFAIKNGHANGKSYVVKTVEPVNAVQPRLIAEPVKAKTFKALYREFVEKSDFLPSDVVLAHFCGVDKSTVSGVRGELREEGYEFTRGNTEYGGWEVTKRPVTRTAEIVANELAEAMKTNSKVAAMKLIVELMELTKA